MMDWRLIEEYNALCNDLEALNEKIMVLLDRKEEIEVQLRRGTNHV